MLNYDHTLRLPVSAGALHFWLSHYVLTHPCSMNGEWLTPTCAFFLNFEKGLPL